MHSIHNLSTKNKNPHKNGDFLHPAQNFIQQNYAPQPAFVSALAAAAVVPNPGAGASADISV